MTKEQNKIVKYLKNNMMSMVPYLGLVLVILIFAITTNGKLFSAYNTRIIIQQSVALAIICVGAVFIYSLGNMDISIGACLGLCTLIEIIILNKTGSLLLGFGAALVLALGFGLVNGVVSTWLGLPSIITSLFLMFIGSGVQTLITLQTNTITSTYDFSLFKSTGFQIAVLVIVVIVCFYLFNFTCIGKYIKSIGANPVCAKQSGINVFRFKMIAYLILGICIAIASLFVLGRSGSSSRVTGNGYHMDVMIAIILGGMPLAGGMKSRISAALIGAFTYILLTNGLTLSGVNVSLVPLVKSVIFLTIVIMTCRKKDGVLPR